MKPDKKRVHNPAWKDSTRAQRQQKRREKLNTIAQAAGYATWSAYETAVIHGESLLLPPERSTLK